MGSESWKDIFTYHGEQPTIDDLPTSSRAADVRSAVEMATRIGRRYVDLQDRTDAAEERLRELAAAWRDEFGWPVERALNEIADSLAPASRDSQAPKETT